MEYDFNIVHMSGVKDKPADSPSRLTTEGRNNSDINGDIPIMAVATCAQKRFREVNNNNPEKAHIKYDEPRLPPFHEVMRGRGTETYCDKVRLTLRTPRSSFNIDKDGSLLRHSPLHVLV